MQRTRPQSIQQRTLRFDGLFGELLAVVDQECFRRLKIGRNPKTGEEIPITARRVVTFRPGQKLKARVETYAGSREQ